jgi:hypothetical protein
MIRRGFWLAVGAAGGIMGYRRVVRMLPQGGKPPARRAPAPHTRWLPGSSRARRDYPSPRSPLARRRRPVRETIRFTRDVREGMDLYIARHPRRVGPTLGANARTEEKDVR